MIIVEFLGPIAREPLAIEALSIADLAVALQSDSELSKWLGKCAVAVNDKMINDLNHKLCDGDRVTLLPPVCGG